MYAVQVVCGTAGGLIAGSPHRSQVHDSLCVTAVELELPAAVEVLCLYQERIRGGACNATVGWVESLLENDVTYGCGKSIHNNFHSPYKESKDSRYIHWLEPPGVK